MDCSLLMGEPYGITIGPLWYMYYLQVTSEMQSIVGWAWATLHHIVNVWLRYCTMKFRKNKV